MKDLIWGIIGLTIAIYAATYLFKLLKLKKTGTLTEAEVIAVNQPQKDIYVHTLRFSIGDSIYEKEDKTGYSQPLNIGDKKAIVYDPKKPEDFEFADQLKRNIIIVSVLIIVALIFSARWIISGVM